MKAYAISHRIEDFVIHLRASGRASSTIDCYRQDLERLACILGNIHPRSIADNDINRVVARIAAEKRNGCRRSSTTINRIKSSYRSFFKWACDSKRIRSNPAERLRLSKHCSHPAAPITAGEVATLLETMRRSKDIYADRDEALFAIYAYTGIRRSEVLPLTLLDYDHGSRLLYLPRTKNGERQIKFVPPPLAAILIKRTRILFREYPSSKGCLLFPGRVCCKPLSARQVQVRFEK